MAKAKTRTFRMRPLDEWALAQAREAMGGNADNTAALQLLVDLGIEVGVQRGYWKPYQPPSIEDRLGPERVAAAEAVLQRVRSQGGAGSQSGLAPTVQQKRKCDEKRNTGAPRGEEPVRGIEEKPAQLFDDGPDLPDGWEPLEPNAYDATCDGCGISGLRWVGPRQPRGLRRFQDRAGTIHNPGACRRRQKAAKSGRV